MRRRSGGRLRPGSDTVRPPTRIVPWSGSMKPATSRKVVVLPQPDGPRRHTKEPCAIVSVRPSSAAASPKRLVSDSSSTTAIVRYRLDRQRKAGGERGHAKAAARPAGPRQKYLHSGATLSI